MSEDRNNLVETAVLMDAERTEVNESEALNPDGVIVDSDNNDSASGSSLLSFHSCDVLRVDENVAAEIEDFMPGLRRYLKNMRGWELSADRENEYRQLFSDWNTYLQSVQGVWETSAIISSNINEDINKIIPWQKEQLGEQWTEDLKGWIKIWLLRWNKFLRVRTGETPVTGCKLFLTIVGYILYLLDMGSDGSTAIFFVSTGQWWQALVTLAIIYGAVIFYTAVKWRDGLVHCTDAADWLRYVALLLVNWPDMKQYGALCKLEWQLYRSPVNNASLVPEWDKRRCSVAHLKLTEGVWEACPQAILQLCLLVPDLYGTWQWTDYFRIAGACISLCAAGFAPVNWVKFNRITYHTDLPLGELVVLHVWAVPVTVSRLLSVALLLSVHPYWVLAGGALHLVLHGVFRCSTGGVPRTPGNVIITCLYTLLFCMSPFGVADSVMYRRVVHVIHLLGNSTATVVWALGTLLLCAHPALYTAIICCNAAMFAVGLVAWQLHEKHWPSSYFI